MGQLNGSRIYRALVAFFVPLDDTDKELVANLYGRTRKEVHITDGGTAATAQTATTFFTNDTGSDLLIKSAQVMTPVSITGNDTNNATFTLDKVDATGANAATIAALTTNVASGGTTAHKPAALALTVANVVLAPGWSMRIAVSKASSGVAIAAATSQAYVQVQYEPLL